MAATVPGNAALRRAICALALLLAPACSWIAPFSSAPGDAGGPDRGDGQTVDLPADGPGEDAGPDADLALDTGPDGPPRICAAGWCWLNPYPQGLTLRGVWGRGPTDIFAVGQGTALRYDGSSWRAEPLDEPWDLHDVSGASPNLVLAVGQRADASGVVVRRAAQGGWGLEWTTANPLRGVSAWSATGAMAVGLGGTIARFDGSWQLLHGEFGADLEDVWTSGWNVWMVGAEGTIVHKAGTEWIHVVSGTTAHLRAIWGAAPSTLVVVGDGGTVLVNEGGGFSPLPVLAPNPWLQAVWATGPDDIYVGAGQLAKQIARWDGSSWSSTNLPRPVLGLWGAGASDLLAVGQHGMIYRKSGTAWQAQWSSFGLTVEAFWVVSPTDVIAATFPYNIWRLEGTATAWRSMDAPADMLVADFWGSGPSDLFAAGNAGPATILRFDGTSWEKAWQGSSGAFVQGIWGCGPSDVHAVGTDGLVIALQGTQWQTLPPPGNPAVGLWSVWSPCDGSGDYFAVGRDELVYRGAGSSWTPIPTPEDRDLFGVYGLGPTEVWAVGGGVVLRFAASGFVEQLDPGGTMHNIWAASSTELYVLGPAGFLHTADGTSWTTPAPPPALTSWVDVQGVPGSAVFAASYGGAQLLVHPLQ